MPQISQSETSQAEVSQRQVKQVPRSRGAPTADEFVARAEAIVPALREYAAKAEAIRTVPDESMALIREAGLLKAFIPSRYGGYDLNWGAQINAGRVVAHGCPSAAWLVSVVGSHAAYIGRMRPEAQDDVWGDGRDVLVCTGSVPRGVRVEAVEGGFRVSGQWGFSSGVDHAEWALLRGVPEGLPPSANTQNFMLFPKSDFEIVDDWFVSGMKGTGSKSVKLDNVFVPEYRTLPLPVLFNLNPPGAAVNDNPVCRYNFRAYAGSALMGPIVGAAEAAFALFLDELKTLKNVEDPYIQVVVGETDAEVHTARYLLERVLETQNYYAARMEPVPIKDRVAFVRDRAYAARLSLRAVDRMVQYLNIEQAFLDTPIQRYHRDMHAMCQQIGINWDRSMTNSAKQVLGLETEIPYLNES